MKNDDSSRLMTDTTHKWLIVWLLIGRNGDTFYMVWAHLVERKNPPRLIECAEVFDRIRRNIIHSLHLERHLVGPSYAFIPHQAERELESNHRKSNGVYDDSLSWCDAGRDTHAHIMTAISPIPDVARCKLSSCETRESSDKNVNAYTYWLLQQSNEYDDNEWKNKNILIQIAATSGKGCA